MLIVNVVYGCRHAYGRKDEYRAWVKNVAPMENMMNDFQKVQ